MASAVLLLALAGAARGVKLSSKTKSAAYPDDLCTLIPAGYDYAGQEACCPPGLRYFIGDGSACRAGRYPYNLCAVYGNGNMQRCWAWTGYAPGWTGQGTLTAVDLSSDFPPPSSTCVVIPAGYTNEGKAACCPPGYHFYGDGSACTKDGTTSCIIYGNTGSSYPSCIDNENPLYGGATALNDPHLTNIDGVGFDVARTGEHVLIEIPRGAHDRPARLRLSARVDDVAGRCLSKHMYAREVKLTGTSLQDLDGSIEFNLNQVHDNCTSSACLVRVQMGQGAPASAEDAASKHPSMLSVAPLAQGGQRIKMNLAGSVIVKIDVILSFRRWIKIAYFNVAVSGVGLLNEDVGGILGHDDHTFAATAPEGCDATQLAKLEPGTGGSHFTAVF